MNKIHFSCPIVGDLWLVYTLRVGAERHKGVYTVEENVLSGEQAWEVNGGTRWKTWRLGEGVERWGVGDGRGRGRGRGCCISWYDTAHLKLPLIWLLVLVQPLYLQYSELSFRSYKRRRESFDVINTCNGDRRFSAVSRPSTSHYYRGSMPRYEKKLKWGFASLLCLASGE